LTSTKASTHRSRGWFRERRAFCNVFRIRRWKELLWTAVCLVNVACWLIAGPEAGPAWGGVLLVQTPLTIALIANEIRHPVYHGVRADRWNPHLADYLAGR
jgi:hypothetical protein